jgi:hypothetical protein
MQFSKKYSTFAAEFLDGNVKVNNNVSVYTGVTFNNIVVHGFLMFFTNLVNPLKWDLPPRSACPN